MGVPWQIWVFGPYLLAGWFSRRAGALNVRWFVSAIAGAALGGLIAWGMWRASYVQPANAHPTAWIFPMMMMITLGAWFGGFAGSAHALARSGHRNAAGWFCLGVGLTAMLMFLVEWQDGQRSLVADLRDLASGVHWPLALCVWGAWLMWAGGRRRGDI